MRIIFTILLIAFSCQLNAQTNYAKLDYFMYLFIKNIEWPDSIQTDPFYVGVLGSGDYVEHLQKLEYNQPFFDKKIKIKVFEEATDISFCHIIFIPDSESERMKDVMRSMSPNTLLVTETPGHAFAGSGINIFWENKGKDIHYELNTSAFRKAGLKIKAQLVSMATR